MDPRLDERARIRFVSGAVINRYRCTKVSSLTLRSRSARNGSQFVEIIETFQIFVKMNTTESNNQFLFFYARQKAGFYEKLYDQNVIIGQVSINYYHKYNPVSFCATLFASLFGSFLNNDPFYDGDNEIPKLSIIETLIGSSHGRRRRVSYVPEVERVPARARGSMSVSNTSNSTPTYDQIRILHGPNRAWPR